MAEFNPWSESPAVQTKIYVAAAMMAVLNQPSAVKMLFNENDHNGRCSIAMAVLTEYNESRTVNGVECSTVDVADYINLALDGNLSAYFKDGRLCFAEYGDEDDEDEDDEDEEQDECDEYL